MQGNTLFNGPMFRDGAEVTDSAVREGTTLILLESKASTIRNGINADDPAALQRVLESRFIEGEGHGRKGLAQLSHAIKRFADGNPIVDRASGQQILPADIRKIIPVLVHLDNTLRTPGIPHYMSARFKSLGRAKRFTVTPLVLLPITELEELEGHLADTVMSAFLESFIALEGRQGSGVPDPPTPHPQRQNQEERRHACSVRSLHGRHAPSPLPGRRTVPIVRVYRPAVETHLGLNGTLVFVRQILFSVRLGSASRPIIMNIDPP
jgi:hypothetical protein